MSPDPVRLAETRAWFVKAANDLRAGDVALAAAPPLLEDALFHCQQAVEKALKGMLLWHDRPFRRVHDLAALGSQCAEIAPALEPLLREAAPLTEYASRFRYPGDYPEPTREECAERLALSRGVVEAVLMRLPAEVRP